MSYPLDKQPSRLVMCHPSCRSKVSTITPVAQGTNMLTNYSNATYHSLQTDYRRRFTKGVEFQVNYVFSKSLSDRLETRKRALSHFLIGTIPDLKKHLRPLTSATL